MSSADSHTHFVDLLLITILPLSLACFLLQLEKTFTTPSLLFNRFMFTSNSQQHNHSGPPDSRTRVLWGWREREGRRWGGVGRRREEAKKKSFKMKLSFDFSLRLFLLFRSISSHTCSCSFVSTNWARTLLRFFFSVCSLCWN